jgi:ribulose-phosphate 3-epimerase
MSKTIELIKKEGKKVGISLKPKSSINLIKEFLEEIDLVLIMSVEPGFGGQKFMPEVINKIKEVKNIVLEKKIDLDIEIDGGINFNNCKMAKEAGANILVSGSTIFKENNGDLKKNIDLLRSN